MVWYMVRIPYMTGNTGSGVPAVWWFDTWSESLIWLGILAPVSQQCDGLIHGQNPLYDWEYRLQCPSSAMVWHMLKVFLGLSNICRIVSPIVKLQQFLKRCRIIVLSVLCNYNLHLLYVHCTVQKYTYSTMWSFDVNLKLGKICGNYHKTVILKKTNFFSFLVFSVNLVFNVEIYFWRF